MEPPAAAAAVPRPAGRARLAAAGAVALLCAISFVWYRECLLSFFFFDDFWVMRDAAHVAPGDFVGIFRLSHAGFQLYRPLTTVGFLYVLRALFGYDASGYHLVQLIIFTLNGLLAFAIARRLTDSLAAALAVGMLYLLAPGQAVGVYWLAAFTVTGTAFAILLALWIWLVTAPPWRALLCTLLQIVGLLASEHAVTMPVLLAVLIACTEPRQRWWRRARELLPLVVIVAAYGIAKVWYFSRVRPVYPGYRMGFDVVVWLQHLGQYAIACFNVTTLLEPTQTTATLVGGGLVALLALGVWQSRRHQAAWPLLAGGLALSVVGLAPVFPLSTHYKDHYIAVAALGMALALVAVCQLMTRRWRELVLALAAMVLVVDIVSGGRAWRSNPTFLLVQNGGYIGAAWIHAVSQATHDDGSGTAVIVPNNPVTASVFVMGEVQTYFPSVPAQIVMSKPGKAAPSAPGITVDSAADLPPDAPLPGWDSRWNVLRWMARAGR